MEFLAELGVIFLMFMIGLDMSMQRLWSMRRLVFGLGGLQVVLTAAAIGLLAARFGNGVEASVILGVVLVNALIVSMVLQLRRELEARVIGRDVDAHAPILGARYRSRSAI